MIYYLAIDIGASGGRHILGSLQNGKIELEEVFRFENAIVELDGNLTWNIDLISENIIKGLKKCKEIGKIPSYIGIDTWGVDYVLLGENKEVLAPVFAYRDAHTEGMPEKVFDIVTQKELYQRTGIVSINFNSIYQLFRDKLSGKLQNAKHFLMMPDYFSYVLTDKMSNEYTIASTGGLVNAETKTWDYDIIEKLGFPKEMFLPLTKPGDSLGHLSQDIISEVGFDAEVIRCPGHDTACAVASCPIDETGVFISSGTWSLIGTECKKPNLDFASSEKGFTNEGGIEYRFRFLENIMGMWLFQNIRNNLGKKFSYDEMMKMAMNSTFDKTVNPNDKSFEAPDNMIEAIRKKLGEKDLPIEDVLKCVYLSLAHSYDRSIKTIENLSNKKVNNILITGGGSKDKYLNELTGKITGKKVFIGLNEGTATGNILSQIMFSEKISLDEGRQLIKNSFEIKENL